MSYSEKCCYSNQLFCTPTQNKHIEIIGPPLAAPVCNCHSLILHLLSSASPCSRSNRPTLPCSQHSASKRLAGHSSLAPVADQCQDLGSHCLHSSLAVACPMT